MRFTIKTIGCKVNTYESNKIRDDLIKLGFDYIDVNNKDEYKNLDYYIVNTCSVTAIADKKSRQMLHLAKKYNPNVKVIAIGCLIDSLDASPNGTVGAKPASPHPVGGKQSSGLFSTASPLQGVDYILSNKQKSTLPDLIKDLAQVHSASLRENLEASTTSPRAFIKIQDGCDEYCTYCLIPYLRGHIKSRDDDDIVSEITDKVKNGVKEVVLTGIHLSSFGLDRENTSYEREGAISIAQASLTKIIEKIANIKVDIEGETKEILRMRLGSLEPRIIDEGFIKFLTDEESLVSKKFCPNFCLSLQSGSDKILTSMNRHYTIADFKNACDLIRKYMKDATITTDVIVGFPGETDEDFEESLEFVKSMRFYNPNIFPYSIRKGTKAATFPNQLTNKVKHDRCVKMIYECEKISKEIESLYAGDVSYASPMAKPIVRASYASPLARPYVGASTASPYKIGDIINGILIEEIMEDNDGTFAIGYTKNYIKRKIQLVGASS